MMMMMISMMMTTMITIMITINISVDNDAHFMVKMKGVKEGICFDVNGHAGDIFQLVYDRRTGQSFGWGDKKGQSPNDMLHLSQGKKASHPHYCSF